MNKTIPYQACYPVSDPILSDPLRSVSKKISLQSGEQTQPSQPSAGRALCLRSMLRLSEATSRMELN